MKNSDLVALKCQLMIEDLVKCLREDDTLDGVLRITRKLGFAKRNIISKREENTTKKHTKTGNAFMKYMENMAKKIPSIEDSFDKLETYPSVTERYYKQLYYIHKPELELEPHCVLVHSNKICLITLALSHPIIKNKKKIIKLDFQVTNKLDRLENKVSGKGKKGGQHIMPDSPLCFVECEDGTKYTIRGCMKGKLIEINQLLLKDPNIMVEKPLSQGFIAIILPSIKDLENYKNKLLTQETYENELCSNV